MLEFLLGYSAGSATASRAAQLARSAAVASGNVHSHSLEDMNERVDSMALILRALWALLEEQGLTADQLIDKIEELDLLDGKADGKVTALATDCPSCGSKVAAGLNKCQFCGTDVRAEDPGPLGDL